MDEECRVAFSTSRLPSKKTLEFINDLVVSLSGTCKIVRGKKSFVALIEEAVSMGAKLLAFIWEGRGGMPSSLRFYDVETRGWRPYVIKISGIKTRREYPVFVARRPRARSAVIVDLAGGELGELFVEIFHYPLLYSVEGVVTFDTVILIRRDGEYIVEILGNDLGPRASSFKVAKVVYV